MTYERSIVFLDSYRVIKFPVLKNNRTCTASYVLYKLASLIFLLLPVCKGYLIHYSCSFEVIETETTLEQKLSDLVPFKQ